MTLSDLLRLQKTLEGLIASGRLPYFAHRDAERQLEEVKRKIAAMAAR